MTGSAKLSGQLSGQSTRLAYAGSILALTFSLAAYGGGSTTTATGCTDPAGDTAAEGVSGAIQIDDSSTVFPISEAMAEEFQMANSGTRVTVGNSGSGGGFKKFWAGKTDISNASRPMKDV